MAGEGQPADDDGERTVVERDITLLGAEGARVGAQLRGWNRNGFANAELRFADRTVTARDQPDYFTAMQYVRATLEPEFVPLINAARRDVWAGGVARDVGAGMQAYVLEIGRAALPGHLVDIFEDAAVDDVATLAEQHAFMETWVASLHRRRGGGR